MESSTTGLVQLLSEKKKTVSCKQSYEIIALNTLDQETELSIDH